MNSRRVNRLLFKWTAFLVGYNLLTGWLLRWWIKMLERFHWQLRKGIFICFQLGKTLVIPTRKPGRYGVRSFFSIIMKRIIIKILGEKDFISPSIMSHGACGEEPACQWRRCKRQGFSPWVGKTPWRMAWKPQRY